MNQVYKTNTLDIREFADRCYKMWTVLPKDISMQEPFHTLSYADDCLSYGDEKQTRELYEKAFDFYKE